MPTFSAAGASVEPDQRFDGLELAEEEPPGLELLGIRPVLQQALGDAGDAGIAGLAPCLDTRADLVDERDLDEDAGIVEGPWSLRRRRRNRPAGARPRPG